MIPENTKATSRFIEIDEDGYFKLGGLRVSDVALGLEWLKNITMDRGRAITQIGGESVFIEAFDQPYMALGIEKREGGRWSITMPYGHREFIKLDSLTVDEWDRFLGHTDREGEGEPVPFILSRSAQSRLFNLVDDFDDDSITVDGKKLPMRPWLSDHPDAHADSFWTNLYKTGGAGWELGEASHVLPTLVPQLKLQRARILVPGAGSGNDAAWLASQGHIVTALDFSSEAVAKAKEKYGHLPNLKFMQADVFSLPQSMNGTFDIIFEHTLYCAIPPSRRNDLVKIWRRLLIERGHLLGVFFVMDRPIGPPYGGSEWELRSRLQDCFRSLYWTRLRDSRADRMAKELFVYAQKTSVF